VLGDVFGVSADRLISMALDLIVRQSATTRFVHALPCPTLHDLGLQLARFVLLGEHLLAHLRTVLIKDHDQLAHGSGRFPHVGTQHRQNSPVGIVAGSERGVPRFGEHNSGRVGHQHPDICLFLAGNFDWSSRSIASRASALAPADSKRSRSAHHRSRICTPASSAGERPSK
jgi:hypothetical protein